MKKNESITISGDHNVHSVFGGKVVDKREIVYNYGLNAEEVDALCKDMAEKLIKELPIKMSEEVKGIVGEIVDNKVSAILLHMEKQAKSEDDLRNSIAHNFDDMREHISDIKDEILEEFKTLYDDDREELENLARLCRETAHQADEAFGNIIGALSKIKDIAQEFKDNIRLDHTYELTQGWVNIREGRFKQAKDFFDRALQQIKNEAEAYFGMYLADCKIQVLWDCVNCRWQPIFRDIVALDESLENNTYYNSALRYAADAQRKAYEEFNEEIKDTAQEFENIENVKYDCFICVKVKDNDKKYTDDSHDAMFLYGMLKDAGYYPFYSEMNVRYMKGKEYEAHILYALYKAKCMIVVCSNKAYLDTPWVKNEYTRYIDMMKSGDKHRDSIRIAYRGRDIERLPGINHSLESINLSEMDSGYRIEKFVKHFVKSEEESTALRKENVTKAKMTTEAEAKTLEAERQAREAEAKVRELERQLEEERKALEADRKAREAEAAAKAKEEAERKARDDKIKARFLSDYYPTLNNYDRNEFEIYGTTLKEYKGKKREVEIPKGVTSIGENAFAGNKDMTSIIIPNTVKSIGRFAIAGCTGLTYVLIPDSVTSIGESAFYRSDRLTEVSMPNSVARIGFRAFEECEGLTSIVIPNSVQRIEDDAFMRCTGLRSVTISNGVKSIGKSAFCWCAELTSINIPGSVTRIEGDPFNGCIMLEDITVDEGNPQYRSEGNCLIDKKTGELVAGCRTSVIPSSVTNIGAGAFGNCQRLTSITIPDSVKKIGDAAFYRCTGLTSVTIPNSVTNIEYGAFEDCTSLTAVTISNRVDRINQMTFSDCTGLKKIEIPNNVKSIGGDAFRGCTGLTSITIPSSVRAIENHAFCDCKGLTSITIPDGVASIEEGTFEGCIGLTSITIPGSVTSIRNNPFSGCKALESISVDEENPNYRSEGNCIIDKKTGKLIAGCKASVIPSDVTSIGECAFLGCTDLTSIEIPNSVKRIEKNAFFGTGLTSIEIPNGVWDIGESAFQGCTGLTSIMIPGSVKRIGKDAFLACSLRTVYYVGTSEDWEKIAIDNHLHNNNVLKNATRYYKPAAQNAVSASSGASAKADAAYDPTPENYDKNEFRIEGTVLKKCRGRQEDVKIPYGVTRIEANAFSLCKKIKSVTIPGSVTSIGRAAFYGCVGLTSIVIPNSVTSIEFGAFECCYALTSITIPSSVTSIGDRVFQGCSGLTSVTIPNSVASIGDWAFQGCEELSSITIPNSVTSIGDHAFQDCTGLEAFTIPSSVTRMGESVFFGCTGLKSISIPDSVTSIGKRTFQGCTGLTTVTLPNSVTSIGEAAFIGCECLTSIAIPDSVTTIEYGTFYSCTGLKTVAIPSSVTIIGKEAFNICSSLNNVCYEGTSEQWDKMSIAENNDDLIKAPRHYKPAPACDDAVFRENYPTLETCDSDEFRISGTVLKCYYGVDEEVKIPYGVTSIGDEAFGFGDLISVMIPSTVTSIGREPFASCEQLESIKVDSKNPRFKSAGNCLVDKKTGELIAGCNSSVIPSDVTSIGSGAFNCREWLACVTIPAGVTSIGEYAFSDCAGLKIVYYEGTSEQWNKISISENNDELKKAPRYYYSKQPIQDGKHWHFDGAHTPKLW